MLFLVERQCVPGVALALNVHSSSVEHSRSVERLVDPEIALNRVDETPQETIQRTRHLLARSRATLDAANERLGHYEHAEAPLTLQGSDPAIS